MKKINFSEKGFLREEIGGYMKELGKRDSRVVVVNADLMKSSRNRSFVEQFPDRSFNLGIAEQNMVSFAAGLAHEGFIPYAFSMVPFLSMRACEQCRTDVAYGNLSVRLMATYAGVSGGVSGATHWGIEDCGIMRSIPNMVVLEPSDIVQAKRMMDATLAYEGPIYIRMGIEPVAKIYNETYVYHFGKASVPKGGEDGAYICSGVTVQYALEASEWINAHYGLHIQVVDMHTLKPIDRNAVIRAAETGYIVAAQDHNVEGGLGNAVAEVIAEEGISVKFKNTGIPDVFETMAHASFLYHKFGYDTEGLIKQMLALRKVEF